VATFTWSRRARGLTTFCVHLFQHLDGEQLLGDELLQLRVLGDERLHLLDLVDGLAAAALPLDVQRLLGDAELLRDLVVVTGVLPAGCRTTFSIRFQSRVARAQRRAFRSRARRRGRGRRPRKSSAFAGVAGEHVLDDSISGG
jgi:hypothetical protein